MKPEKKLSSSLRFTEWIFKKKRKKEVKHHIIKSPPVHTEKV